MAPPHLLSQKVADLDGLSAILHDQVDGEMRVDGADLVAEALCDTGDHVVDEGLDGTQAGDVLAGSVPDDELDGGVAALGLGLDETKIHVDVLDGLYPHICPFSIGFSLLSFPYHCCR